MAKSTNRQKRNRSINQSNLTKNTEIRNHTLVDPKPIEPTPEKQASSKKSFKKFYNGQAIAIYIAIIVGIIGWLGYYKTQERWEKEDTEKQYQRMIDEHEFLELYLKLFKLEAGEYTIDYVMNHSNYPTAIPFLVSIENNGTKSAKNTKIEFGTYPHTYVKTIFKHPHGVKDFIDDSHKGGVMTFDDFIPRRHSGIPVLYARDDEKAFKTGDEIIIYYELFCQDKARPVKVKFYLRIFHLESMEHYKHYINTHKDKYGDFNDYVLTRDFIVISSETNGSFNIDEVHKPILHNGETRFETRERDKS